ncbi:MAG: L-threonylcarbamoyladenylate synthase [Pseudomonadales bacterium]|nr:L-threonylcarbamoyladenylate synthase [Pseudomonadales bacterium]MCP5183501.1 L-threonylcarbamoyladenylate synthase [Pseudomonadales bacterium]
MIKAATSLHAQALPACRWDAFHLARAVRVLRRGGVVLHATEGVWGLACDASDTTAVSRILTIKRRAATKGLILIGGLAAAFADELAGLDPTQRELIEASWPGPVTWILPTGRFSPLVTGGTGSVAVRVPGHEQARCLAMAFGRPLVSTSANVAGRPAATRSWQAVRAVGTLVDYVLPGATGGRRGASEIRRPGGVVVRQR